MIVEVLTKLDLIVFWQLYYRSKDKWIWSGNTTVTDHNPQHRKEEPQDSKSIVKVKQPALI